MTSFEQSLFPRLLAYQAISHTKTVDRQNVEKLNNYVENLFELWLKDIFQHLLSLFVTLKQTVFLQSGVDSTQFSTICQLRC